MLALKVLGLYLYEGNVAYGKHAWQSSTYFNGVVTAVASYAVDGNIDNTGVSCSRTHWTSWLPEWWVVDLANTYTVTSVTIYRMESDTAGRIFVYLGVRLA